MLKTFAETQVEEGRQAHMREMEIVNRRVAELEEQQKQTVRAWEGRLAAKPSASRPGPQIRGGP